MTRLAAIWTCITESNFLPKQSAGDWTRPNGTATSLGIGEGSGGVVHSGTWRGMRVAIKMLADESVESRDDLIAEAHKLQHLRPHRNIVSFCGVCDSPLMVLMDLVSG